MRINCSPVARILCFVYPDVVHIGYEDEEIKILRKQDFCKYLFNLCQQKNEGHLSITGEHQCILEYVNMIQDYELETYGETPILMADLNVLWAAPKNIK